MSVIQITDLNDPQLDIYARLSEGQLLHYYEPDLGIFIAESPKVIQTAFEQGYEPISLKIVILKHRQKILYCNIRIFLSIQHLLMY